MSALLIDGKEIAQAYRLTMKAEIEDLKKKGTTPGLAVVIVGAVSYTHLTLPTKA